MVARCFEVTILITDKKLKTMEEIERLAFALNRFAGLSEDDFKQRYVTDFGGDTRWI